MIALLFVEALPRIFTSEEKNVCHLSVVDTPFVTNCDRRTCWVCLLEIGQADLSLGGEVGWPGSLLSECEALLGPLEQH